VNDPGVDTTGTGHDNGPAAQVVEEIRRKGGEALANFDSVASMEWPCPQERVQTSY
jgi:hypothetical protein